MSLLAVMDSWLMGNAAAVEDVVVVPAIEAPAGTAEAVTDL